MTRGRKSNSKKKDLVREVNKESEEKWKGLENKIWTVAEFGFYVILLAFTIFAVGYRSSALMNREKGYIVDPGSRQISEKNDTVYYSVTNKCTDIKNCNFHDEANYRGNVMDLKYNVENGVGTLEINKISLTVGPISEFAILRNGYVATFTTKADNNLISYYNAKGELIKEYDTKLSSTGKLDSEVGIYAVCNNGRMDTVKYTVQDDDDFFEELVGSYYSNQCQ